MWLLNFDALYLYLEMSQLTLTVHYQTKNVQEPSSPLRLMSIMFFVLTRINCMIFVNILKIEQNIYLLISEYSNSFYSSSQNKFPILVNIVPAR